jgi:hypothetical protein
VRTPAKTDEVGDMVVRAIVKITMAAAMADVITAWGLFQGRNNPRSHFDPSLRSRPMIFRHA